MAAREVVVVDSVRTGLAKAHRGSFNLTRSDDMLAHCVDSLLERNPNVAPEEVEDVVVGAANHTGEQDGNLARLAVVLSKLPISTAGLTINRFCSSGLQAIAQRPPDFVIVENVPGLHNAFGLDIYQKFMAMLETHGFRSDSGLLDAKDYGVPQTRKRFILVAAKAREPRLPVPTTKNSPITVRECIEKYPPLDAGEQDAAFANHAARKLPPHHQKIVAAVPTDGGSRRDVADTSILLPCHRRHPKAHKDVFGRMAWDAPSPTLTCRCTDVYCGRFTHPEQDRGISLREAAALQTFDDGYEFFGGSFLEQARQIGNAVPVRLAEALGRAAMKCLQSTNS